jgi:phage gp36-like protein
MPYQFITEEDLTTDIQPQFLAIISQDNTTGESTSEEIAAVQARKEKAEASSISKMSSYLSNRFDSAVIFNTASTYGDKELIKEYLCNLVRYRLWRSVNPRNVSEQVKDDYNEVMDWLDGIAENTIHPSLPPITATDTLRTDEPIWGGDGKVTNFKV